MENNKYQNYPITSYPQTEWNSIHYGPDLSILSGKAIKNGLWRCLAGVLSVSFMLGVCYLLDRIFM